MHVCLLQHAVAHSSMLQHAATRCNTLQLAATSCNKLQHPTTHCNTLQQTAAHGNTLQHTATHHNTLQHTATPCNAPQHTFFLCFVFCFTPPHCNTLQQNDLEVHQDDLEVLNEPHAQRLNDSITIRGRYHDTQRPFSSCGAVGFSVIKMAGVDSPSFPRLLCSTTTASGP